MRFTWKPSPLLHGVMSYRRAEYSIDFAPNREEFQIRIGGARTGCIMIGSLQLEVSTETGEVFFPWGLFPYTRWKERRLNSPVALQGRLFVIDTMDLVPGGGVDLPGATAWKTWFDRESGWLYTGVDCAADVVVEFASNICASIVNEGITGLWLKFDFDH